MNVLCIVCAKEVDVCRCQKRQRSEEDLDLQARLILTMLGMMNNVDSKIGFIKDRLREEAYRHD